MSYATGISRASVLHTSQWTHHMNYMRLAFAWFLVVSLAVIIVVTVVRFGKKPFVSEEKGRKKLIIVWVVLGLIQAVAMLWGYTGLYKYIMENIFEMAFIYRLISIVISWSKIIVFTMALVFTARFIKMKKQR